jgi:hypothetical protein
MNPATKKLFWLLAAWGGLALAAGFLRLLAHLPPVGVQLVIAGLTTAFAVALRRHSTLAAGAAALGIRPILAFHLVRLVGLYFLWLQAQGRIPAEFAQRAGWGDIAAALAAGALLCWPDGVGFRRALLAWNLLGAADLFVAVGTAGWLNLTRPGSMVELTRLPLALVPLWIVPVLLASHVYLARRCLKKEEEGTGSRKRVGELEFRNS